jgi:hypothetical protein
MEMTSTEVERRQLEWGTKVNAAIDRLFEPILERIWKLLAKTYSLEDKSGASCWFGQSSTGSGVLSVYSENIENMAELKTFLDRNNNKWVKVVIS